MTIISRFFFSKKNNPDIQTRVVFFFSCLIISSFIFCITSCQTVPTSQTYSAIQLTPENIQWQISTTNPWFSCIDFESSYNNIQWHAVKINLKTEGLCIQVFPDQLSEKGKSITLKSFVQKTQSIIAVNTTPFTINLENLKIKRNLIGLCISQKKLISTPLAKYSALLLKKGTEKNKKIFKAQIIDSQQNYLQFEPDYAIGGYWTILRNGTIYDFKNFKDARTACGINKQGSQLIFLTVESKNSSGLSFMECAQILKKLGAYTALEFDGGSSSKLFIKNHMIYKKNSLTKIAGCIGFKKQ